MTREIIKAMGKSHFSLFLLFCCILALPEYNAAKQSDRLKILMQSVSSASYIHSTYVSNPFATKNISPESLISPQDGTVESDKIMELPGQPNEIDFSQYGGYVTVDQTNGRALFYYFVESPQDSSSKPLVLWLNGGPGCSSLGYGAMEELGPFRVSSDGKTLYKNPYAWNNVANILFLESPAGVGFSYSNTTSDYHQSGDERTAEDNYVFLINWLERFPQYKNHEFFITGESYAGHYIPQLANLILERNKIYNKTVINLRGIAIGNAYVDGDSNEAGQVEFLWSHALYSDETHAEVRAYCNYSSEVSSDKCNSALHNASVEIGDIDIYNIYAPKCTDSESLPAADIVNSEFDPCTYNYVYNYLNNPAVQKELHARQNTWKPCSRLGWNDTPYTMKQVIKQLMASGIKFWLYSGDVDGMVPIASTRLFIKNLKLRVKNQWRPWYIKSEVGGYIEEYEGLTLATVRGAGHEVPSYQPERALCMITSFFQGNFPSC